MTRQNKKTKATLCARRARKTALRQQRTVEARTYEAVARHATATAVVYVKGLMAERAAND